MSFKNSLRDRAIAAWFKTSGIAKDDPHLQLFVSKSRSKKTISVRDNYFPSCLVVWSYKNCGKLEKVA